MKQTFKQMMFLFFLCIHGLVYTANHKEEYYIQHVNYSIQLAEKEQSKLGAGQLAIHGMSSPKVRHLLNNLCNLPKATYLEIGCWKGSTLIAALSGNERQLQDAVAIESFSAFGQPREEFFQNVKTFIPFAPLRFFEAECFSIDKAATFRYPINVYFYDGNHDFLSQHKAFSDFNAFFDDVFIAVVDDWNWGEVRDGTRTAFKELGYQILFEREFLTNSNGDMNSWWNGLYVGVIRRPS